jgi:hypothetical protein
MTENNNWDPFMGKIVRVDTEKHKLPLFGRLVGISDQFLTLERRDGRLTMIKRKTILAIEPTVNQHDEVI